MVDFPTFDQVIESRKEKFLAGLTAKQFVIFRGVTEKILEHIDHERRNIGGNMRFNYNSDCEELKQIFCSQIPIFRIVLNGFWGEKIFSLMHISKAAQRERAVRISKLTHHELGTCSVRSSTPHHIGHIVCSLLFCGSSLANAFHQAVSAFTNFGIYAWK